ncbi:MAG: hypothetical protein ACYYK0_01605 [Candidatus Eutrophobiaceae bacterium]
MDRRAVEQGEANAQNTLGGMYAYGKRRRRMTRGGSGGAPPSKEKPMPKH